MPLHLLRQLPKAECWFILQGDTQVNKVPILAPFFLTCFWDSFRRQSASSSSMSNFQKAIFQDCDPPEATTVGHSSPLLFDDFDPPEATTVDHRGLQIQDLHFTMISTRRSRRRSATEARKVQRLQLLRISTRRRQRRWHSSVAT